MCVFPAPPGVFEPRRCILKTCLLVPARRDARARRALLRARHDAARGTPVFDANTGKNYTGYWAKMDAFGADAHDNDDDAESIALAAKLRADAEARALARLAAREAKLRALKESSAEQLAVTAPPLPPPPSIPEPPQQSVSSTSAVQAPLNALEASKTQVRVVRCTSFKRRGVKKPTRKDVPSSAIEANSPAQRGLYAQRLQRARSQRSASGTRGSMPIADGDGDHDHEMGITIHPQ